MQLRDFSKPNLDLDGKSVLVTGGTGSFGRRFVARVLDRYARNGSSCSRATS